MTKGSSSQEQILTRPPPSTAQDSPLMLRALQVLRETTGEGTGREMGCWGITEGWEEKKDPSPDKFLEELSPNARTAKCKHTTVSVAT